MSTETRKCGGCGRSFESRFDSNFCDSCQEPDEDDNREPDYWMCGCGRMVTKRLSASEGCPRCGSIMEECFL